MPYSARRSQQQGYVHTGAIMGIVDSACGYAALIQATIVNVHADAGARAAANAPRIEDR